MASELTGVLRGACVLLVVVVAVGLVPEAAWSQGAGPRITEKVREQLLERIRLLDAEEQAAELADSLARDTASAVPESPSVGGAPAAARRALLDQLLDLDGYTITEYQGTAAFYDVDSATIRLSGPSEVIRAGQAVTADSMLVLDMNRMILCGFGQPVLTSADAAEPVESDQVCYDVDRRLGEARDARTRFTEGATWIVVGERVYPVGSDRVYSHNTMFTDCDEEDPHYHFAASQVKVVANDVLVARNVTLKIRDVPILWLPFMVQSMKQGRRSGFLTPRLGINDIVRNQSSYARRISNVGYYWAINDYMDAEVALDWFSGNWTALEGSFRYSWAEKFLNGNLTFRRFWQESGTTNFTLSTANSWEIDERTSIRVSANYTSSSDFVRRESRDPFELNRTIDSSAGLNRNFGWGRLSLGASRKQYLGDDRVELTLPSFGLNLSPVTFFSAPPDQARWYNNGTWNASVTGRSSRSMRPDTVPDRQILDVTATSAINLGGLSWNQSATVNEEKSLLKGFAPDSTRMRARWSTGLSYQQRLIGTSTFTPSLTFSGEVVNSPVTDGRNVSAPVRMSFGAGLRTDVFGFFPGVGPFAAFRHRVSPSITYSYSPAVKTDSLQEAVFGRVEAQEQNRITIGLNQTIEAKFKRDLEAAEEVAQQEATGEVGQAPVSDEPRRLPQARPVTLLSLQTSAVVYDFVQARDPEVPGQLPGLVTAQVTHNVSTDLLRALSLSFAHDLFEVTRDESNKPVSRRFAPHLRSVNASLNVSGGDWLFRLLGLAARGSSAARARPDSAQSALQDEPTPLDDAGLDLIGSRRRSGGVGPQSYASGPMLRVSLSYSLTRPRPSEDQQKIESLMARGSLGFQPTENWSVNWSTGYSFTDGQFSDHVLTLSREMHDWHANFDFVRAQNGNFTFQFRVQLKANPDIKLDYEQRDDPFRP